MDDCTEQGTAVRDELLWALKFPKTFRRPSRHCSNTTGLGEFPSSYWEMTYCSERFCLSLCLSLYTAIWCGLCSHPPTKSRQCWAPPAYSRVFTRRWDQLKVSSSDTHLSVPQTLIAILSISCPQTSYIDNYILFILNIFRSFTSLILL